MANKTCSKCNKSKSLNEFKYYNRCDSCIRDYRLLRYKENKKALKPKILEATRQRRKNLAVFVDELKKVPCTDCGLFFIPILMDFDHLHSKKMAISKMVHEGFSKNKILKEIEKTEIVCCWCHRTRTWTRQPKYIPKSPIYEKNRKLFHESRNKECAICNKKFEHWQMDFDHLNQNEKEESVSILATTGCSTERLIKEIEKCQVVCVGCHRQKTKADFWI